MEGPGFCDTRWGCYPVLYVDNGYFQTYSDFIDGFEVAMMRVKKRACFSGVLGVFVVLLMVCAGSPYYSGD